MRLVAQDNQLARVGLQHLTPCGTHLPDTDLETLKKQADELNVDDVPTLASLTPANGGSHKRKAIEESPTISAPLGTRDHHPPVPLYTPEWLPSKRAKVKKCLCCVALLSFPRVVLQRHGKGHGKQAGVDDDAATAESGQT